ncbi:MAG: erythronate-4-phosphate dehydrogenase [Porticoccus sp.]|nr:erythronate-4-phosphate dehydrogenase [Porticoccus sp.]
MKIVADESMPLVKELFSPYGDITMLPGRQISSENIKYADVLLTRSVTSVNEELLKNSEIKFVGSATIGTDHIDQVYLRERDICFSNAPGCNSNAVIQYVLSSMFSLRPNWMEQTVGIVGCGSIGGKLYKILNDLGVDCCCYDPFLDASKDNHLVTFEEIIKSDILTLHVPLTVDGPFPTYHLFSDEVFSNLKTDTLLINTSRGAVIDNRTLLNFIKTRSCQISLDVWENEPNILLPLLKVVDICTPHIAGYSHDGKVKGTQMIFEAFCSRYNISEPVIPPKEKLFKLSSDSIHEAIIATFDIKKIDHLMKKTLLKKTGNTSVKFDALRKNCPKRYDFNRYYLKKNTDITLALNLQKIGFTKL